MVESSKYWAIAAMGFAAILVPLTLMFGSYLLTLVGVRPRTPHGEEPPFQRVAYESGMAPIGGAQIQFNFRFYLFALLFVIFDVEVIFLLPWAARFLTLGVVAFLAMVFFIALILIGFLYEWRKGALEWK